MPSHPFFRELLAVEDEVSEEELTYAREVLHAPFGLAYCIRQGFRTRAEKDLAQILSSAQRMAAGEWHPIEAAPDDLAAGLFAFPDGTGGYVQAVIYGYVPSRRPAPPVLYGPRGVQPDSDEPDPTSAKEIAVANGATHWRAIPSHPTCPLPMAHHFLR